MRFANCILCAEPVTTTKDSICPICWQKIYEGKEPTLSSYIALDVSLECFPRTRGDSEVSLDSKANEIKHYAVNLCDLTRLQPVELLLVQGKISSREIVQISKNNLDGSAVLLRSTIKNDYTSNFKERQSSQLKATCELLWKFSKV